MNMNFNFNLFIIALVIAGAIALVWSEQYHTYDKICLTNKPFGHVHQVPAITYWKNLLRNQKARINTMNHLSGRINGVMSHETKVLGNTLAKGEIDIEYYKDPASYCQTHPGKRPCPNHWLVRSDTDKN